MAGMEMPVTENARLGQRELSTGGVWCIDTSLEEYLGQESVVDLRGWLAAAGADVRVEGPYLRAGGVRRALNAVRRPDVEQAVSGHSIIGFDDVIEIGALHESDYQLSIEIDGTEVALQLPAIPNGDEKAAAFDQQKARKLDRVRPILACPACRGSLEDAEVDALRCHRCGSIVGDAGARAFVLLGAGDEEFPLEPPFSSLPYDPDARAMLAEVGEGLVLDDGSGLRYEYFDNVVNLDLSRYPTTDVLGSAARLPFADGVFDGVISVAVLEHVPDPRVCVAEIARVLKPGGWIYAAAPGLQPYHGYPKHYFNATRDGLAELFAEQFEIDDIAPSPFGLPIHALTWFLDRYLRGLPESVRRGFSDMSIGELAGEVGPHLAMNYVTMLDAAAVEDLACVNVLRGTRVAT